MLYLVKVREPNSWTGHLEYMTRGIFTSRIKAQEAIDNFIDSKKDEYNVEILKERFGIFEFEEDSDIGFGRIDIDDLVAFY